MKSNPSRRDSRARPRSRLSMRLLRMVVVAAVALGVAGAVPASPAVAVAGDPTLTNYTINVLVLKYFPVIYDEVCHCYKMDMTVTGDVGGTLADNQAHADSVTTALTQKLS